MGKVFSALGRKATNPVYNYNIEERAQRSIMKKNRPKAPRHESTAKLIEESVKSLPEATKEGLIAKDKELLERLRTVYVSSKDVTPETNISPEMPSRPLPADRNFTEDPEYGFHIPAKVPYGKITLRDAMEAISKHQQDPQLWTAKKVSYEYKIDTGVAEKMLTYFRTFLLVIPGEQKVTRAMLSFSPMNAPLYLNQLPSGKKDESKTEEKTSEKTSKS
ncbi:NADH dehydrogenase [ubiquinone] 1 alpha subcomplex assembly factor 4 [Palaemon carinicauda]|uniref:NADH dehydrogenase [ubiquinone] 1 alpha subcomplex assembly factor 4 n=1 Tax=Palaemon carinicauda TaxID=392227 RepID=UPI0035B5C121